ncbi:hypothetical protein K504DRAFT_465575 [Pleomassaria siparia CBS 279.74]|uniref:Zn(2)-C6 fungal-type domain-containing protein n=1 Tax=Pleomassaria siparia CBS 279.74 TaxID=1314801 RepID=A0A6G1KHF9_9PLEO|nr:hypothetical protein K504DRAFT_465575 [Pleomassaria siparia CBS 279.74]
MPDDILHSPLTSTSNSADRVQKRNGSISAAAATSANARSCVTCRKRKVKCDKKQPCSNCARAKIECIFPGPGRAPRKSRKPPDGELMDRLRRLEGVVQSLNAQVEEHEQEAADRSQSQPQSQSQSQSQDQDQSRQGSDITACPQYIERMSQNVAVDDTVEGLESRFGRLVVDQGRSRYINNSFWASLNNEVEDLKAILIEASDDEEDQHESPDSGYSSQHQGFIFGFSSTSVDMLALHPPPERARQFWAIYKENVDPLVKVLHIPTIEPTLLDAFTHPEKIPKGLECLMFAIYYGAVTSILDPECIEQWGEDRASLLQKYRFGLEQALARANFLYCDEMIILQAFVVFLILLRRNDDARKIWTLTGLVVRIAQTLGIHRDGSHFNLPPFEIEMRRRLWWQVCILDARASEDHGCDPTIVEAQFDTKMPLNVFDKDLTHDMEALPEERTGFTDMTFCLIRFEVANIFRRILYIPPGPNKCSQFFFALTIPEKEKWISEAHQRLEDKYLSKADMTIPLYWVTATISRLVMSKMWLIVYHPHQRRDGGASLPQETKDKLFITSLENIEYSILLETEARTMKWGWLFRTYVQWHAIAFLLSELCVRTKGEAVDRAWRALEVTAGRWWFPLGDPSYRKGKQGCLWKPLRKLMAKARAARERELTLEHAIQALKNGGVVYQDYHQVFDQMHNPASINQPSPEGIDKMLRPAAPRLGEMPNAQPPTWTDSPTTSNLQRDVLNDGHTDMSSFNRSIIDGGFDSVPFPTNMTSSENDAKILHPGQAFTDLSEQGLDFLIRDVMNGIDYGDQPMPMGNDTVSDPQHYPGVPMNSTTQLHHLQTGLNGAMGDFTTLQNPNVFPAPEVGDSPTLMNENGSSGQSSNSPGLETGNMDWAGWDDLVSQYGIEGQTAISNPAGHLGMVHWF